MPPAAAAAAHAAELRHERLHVHPRGHATRPVVAAGGGAGAGAAAHAGHHLLELGHVHAGEVIVLCDARRCEGFA
jgi:hypothetical protein